MNVPNRRLARRHAPICPVRTDATATRVLKMSTEHAQVS